VLVKLKSKDGNFQLVTKSDIPASRYQKVRGYHLELLNVIHNKEGMIYWEPQQIVPSPPYPEFSTYLYEKYWRYYLKVFEALHLGINCDELTPHCRHNFLICNSDRQGEEVKFSLSFLEQLMGFTMVKEPLPPPSTKTLYPSTGDDCLDVKASLLLNFKARANKIWEAHSLEECVLICKQAADCMQLAHGEDNTEWQPLAWHEPDSPTFLLQKPQIITHLQHLGVPIPRDF